MSDDEAIQGLWRLVSVVSNGKPVGTGATHYLFRDGQRKEIWPSVVDTGNLGVAYELHDEIHAKTITLSYFYAKKKVFPDTPNFVRRGFYRLDGDSLQICWGYGGDCPAAFSDEYSIDTLHRDYGPIPETRKPSGKKSLEDDVLGTLEWDDNINYYHAEITIDGRSVSIGIFERDADVAALLNRARKVVSEIREYGSAAKRYAAEQLVDLANDWREGEGNLLTEEDFMARATLESIHFYEDGGVSFEHGDGDMFWGHSIEARMDGNDIFYHVEMAG